MTKNLIIPALMGMAALVSSCGKSEVENVYTQQDKNIESLVKSLAPEESEATVDYLDGVVRVTVKHGDGPRLRAAEPCPSTMRDTASTVPASVPRICS